MPDSCNIKQIMRKFFSEILDWRKLWRQCFRLHQTQIRNHIQPSLVFFDKRTCSFSL